jgi:hypothetical protein
MIDRAYLRMQEYSYPVQILSGRILNRLGSLIRIPLPVTAVWSIQVCNEMSAFH